jgi:hypothetical protein
LAQDKAQEPLYMNHKLSRGLQAAGSPDLKDII